MNGMKERANIELLAGFAPNGKPVYEVVPCEMIGESRCKILGSPGLVLGVAAGDIIEVPGSPKGVFTVIERGMNVCIQIYRNECDDNDALEKRVALCFSDIGGYLDGKTEKQLVCTVPVEAGFDHIENAMESLTEEFPQIQWFYGNVYDSEDGVTPLNWWVKTEE